MRQSADEKGTGPVGIANARVGIDEIWLHDNPAGGQPAFYELAPRELGQCDIYAYRFVPGSTGVVKAEHRRHPRRVRFRASVTSILHAPPYAVLETLLANLT